MAHLELSHADLKAAVDVAGLEEDVLHLDYSGRGMYGNRCPAVYVDNFGEAMAFMIALVGVLADADRGDDIYDLVELARSTRTDGMGRGIVAYWPGLEVTDVEDEEEDEG